MGREEEEEREGMCLGVAPGLPHFLPCPALPPAISPNTPIATLYSPLCDRLPVPSPALSSLYLPINLQMGKTVAWPLLPARVASCGGEAEPSLSSCHGVCFVVGCHS